MIGVKPERSKIKPLKRLNRYEWVFSCCCLLYKDIEKDKQLGNLPDARCVCVCSRA